MTDSRQTLSTLALVGPGRVGRSLFAAATGAGVPVALLGRNDLARGVSRRFGTVLLTVPDREIAAACAQLAGSTPAPEAVGHTSGATGLDALEPLSSAGVACFCLHPLQTFPDGEAAVAGAPCAVTARDETSTAHAEELAERLGMRPVRLAEEHRVAYHAAASMASNLLVALEQSAAELMGSAGVAAPRELLGPLVTRTASGWIERGEAALTGPIARGDQPTVDAHLDEIRRRRPDLEPVYTALAERAREIAGRDGAGAEAGARA